MSRTESLPEISEIWSWLSDVPDPEIPAISLVDLGVVRDVRIDDADERVVVTITPTYSGCPATRVIAADIETALRSRGIRNLRVDTQLSPAWTTAWLTDGGRERLRGFGIAPPSHGDVPLVTITRRRAVFDVACPRCGSTHTSMLSEFGSTPCKAHYRCDSCLEPFDYFKGI